MLTKTNILSFVSATLSVIIGVFVTFAIQDIINGNKIEKNVVSGLKLVVEELTACREDIQGCAEKMDGRCPFPNRKISEQKII